MSDSDLGEGFNLRGVRWPIEDGLPPLYANQFAIVRSKHEVVLVFGEFLPTGFSGNSREEIEDYLNDARVTPLSKIVLSPAGLRALFALLKNQVEQIEESETEGSS